MPLRPTLTLAPLLRRLGFVLPAAALSLPAAALTVTGNGPAMDTDPPGWCATFDSALKGDGAGYRDHVSVQPATDVAVTAKGTSLCLNGLAPGERYEVTFRAGLPGADGSALKDAVTVRASVPDLPPVVRISGSGFVLPRVGSTGLGIETVNSASLRVKVLRASDRLAARLTLARDPERYEFDRIAREDATLVWEGTMAVKSQPNRRVVTSFPVAQAVPERKPGVYLVIAEDAAMAPFDENGDWWREDQRGRSAARWLVETDLAPTAYAGADGLTVVARSLGTAEPLEDIRAVLVGKDNQELATAETDDDGIARFAPGLLRGKGGARPAALMLYGDKGDFTLLDLERAAFDFSDRGAEGQRHAGALDAYVWTERGIYRPGEVVHASLLLRDRQAKAVAGTPVTLVVKRPDGVEYRRVTLTPAAGGATAPITLSAGARRGEWSVAVLLEGGKDPVGEARFEVQDFVPPKLAVTLEPPADGEVLAPGQTVDLAATTRFLYGAPGAGLMAGGVATLERDPEPFPAFKGFTFGPEEPFETRLQESEAVETDAEGKATLSFTVPDAGGSPAPLRVRLAAEVQEPGGRVTRGEVAAPVRGLPTYVGVKPLFSDGRAPEGQEAAFELVTLDAKGAQVARPDLRWSLVEVERDYVWYSQGNGWAWRYTEREKPVAEGTVGTLADKPVRLARGLDWGTYRLVVQDGDARTVQTFYSGWYVAADGQEGTPDKVAVSLDKPKAKPGETVTLKVTPPFAGQMQVVVASDRVHDVQAQEVGAGPVEVEIEADAAWGAGAYALVSFVRPVEAKAGYRPVRAVGLAWIGIDGADRTLEVKVEAPALTRPRTTVPVTLAVAGAGREAFVTLAAVDEGILNLTRYKAPDPLAHFFAKRRLAVEMRDMYGRLLDGNAGPAGVIRQGGDGDLGGAGLPVSSTKVVSLFSGVVQVRDGKAVVPLDVPDFAGNLRLMAVAYDKDRMGSAQADMLVRDPVVAEVVLPRFLAPGDKAEAALLLHNVEGAAGDYQVAVTPSGPLSVAGPPTLVPLAAGERKVFPLGLVADAAGIAGVRLSVAGPGDLKIERDWDLTLRAAQAPVTLAEMRQQAPGEKFAVTPALFEPFQPGTASLTVSYSYLPGIDVAGLLKDLNRYPYGCTEQTVSVALPLLAFPQVAADMGLDQPGDTGLRVDAAIARILDRQKPDGSFGLWGAGDDYAGAWLQMYVLDFLQRAQGAGHPVPPAALASLTGWAEKFLSQRLDSGNDGEGAQASAYGAWLLARAGRANLGDLRYLADRAADGKAGWKGSLAEAQLGAALSLAGDKRRAAEAFARARGALGTAGLDYYASPEREAAATLAVAAGVGDRETVDAAGALVRRQAGQKDPFAWNTQQKGWLLLAAQELLGRDRPGIAVDGVAASTGKDALPSFRPTPEQAAKGLAFTNSGKGEVWRSVVLKGVPKQAPPAASHGGLVLEKTYHGLDGAALDPASLPRNAQVVVVLKGKLDKLSGRRTLVLVDPLPAGWEIEGVLRPGPDGSDPLPWTGQVSPAALREGRDDRFVGVMELGWVSPWGSYEGADDRKDGLEPGEFRLAYVARAVTPGTYARPPATVEDMYDSGTLARTGGGTAVVTGGR